VIERDPSRPDAYHQRAWAHAELDQWPQAAADFARAAEFNPDGAGIWYFRALACLAGDDLDGYRRTCARMLERIAPSAKPPDAYWIVWTCALGPGATAEPAQTVRLAEKVVANPLPAFDSVTALGASLYRARRFKEAVGQLRQAVAAHGSGKSPQRQPIAYTWFFLAMAEHRLGHSDEARKCLELAADSVAKREGKEGLEALGENTIPWNRRVTLQILHREAEAVLKQPE
jgi:tetratricopeptide (TPR) repeat protein